MTYRKGQGLFNEIAKRYDLRSFAIQLTEIPNRCPSEIKPTNLTDFQYVNLHNILFNMTDSEFDEIMKIVEEHREKNK